MVFPGCARVVPLVGRRLAAAKPWPVQQARLFSPWPRTSAIGALIRDMDRLERQVFRDVPSWFARPSAALPIDHAQEAGTQYQVSVDLAGFKPEEIKLALDDAGRRLTISACCERRTSDGSRFAQEVTKVIMLPETIDTENMTSVLHRDGVLAIEAPFKEQQSQQLQLEPHTIPIGRAAAGQPEASRQEKEKEKENAEAISS